MSDVDKIEQLIHDELGPPHDWTPWPGGWKFESATALVDAVYSARAQYETKHGKGVLPKVRAWRDTVDHAGLDSLQGLRAAIGDSPESAQLWAHSFGSLSPAPRRRSRRPDDPLKSAAIRDAAIALGAVGIESATDVIPERRAAVRRAMRSVPGIGKVTADYFLMLLGHPGVKADVMIKRFLERATGVSFTTGRAIEAVTEIADRLGHPVVAMEHAIWAHESARSCR